MSRDIEILIVPGPDGLTVSLAGETHFDFDASGLHIRRIMSHQPRVLVVDASRLTFITSIGMCFLINLRKAMREGGGTMKLTGLQPLVRKALESAHVLSLFEVEPAKSGE